MSRNWYQGIDPKTLQSKFEIYHGEWMPQLDRYWFSDDGYSVMSRLISTEWGKVEHITIQNSKMKGGDVPWSVKQEIKNELFGENRIAIEIFPAQNRLVDVMDVYHLWILPKNFKMPFGIHPKDTKCSVVNRGSLPITQEVIDNIRNMEEIQKGA